MASYLSTAAALVCLIGALLTGCSGGNAESPITMELDCQATIDLIDKPPDTYQPVLDAVALPGPGTFHQIGRTDEDTGLGFAKTGLLVRAGTASTITVADSDQRIGWGTTETAQRIVIPPCAGAAEWLVYAGGFYVPEPACMTLNVETEDGSDEMLFPIDAPCP
jgi:hypothetical protein